eukprot:augustus_masked-scaffold_12-processed-gene-1.9-mRNA-1 protein AED:1.00 eAED:1.00 QI:0/0/0/0/1/1/4/0/1037
METRSKHRKTASLEKLPFLKFKLSSLRNPRLNSSFTSTLEIADVNMPEKEKANRPDHEIWRHTGLRCNLIYVKLKKTASSTMAGVARGIAARSKLYNFKGVHVTTKRKRANYNQCKVISNHEPEPYELPEVINKEIRKNTFLFTFVRNPRKREISEYFHLHVSRGNRVATDQDATAYFQSHYKAATSTKIMARQYAPCRKTFSQIRSNENHRLGNLCVKRIMEEYDFIGVTERLTESLVVLKSLLGLSFSDIIFIGSSKTNGGYDDLGYKIQKTVITPTMEQVLDEKESSFGYFFDQEVWQAANEKLTATITSLGTENIQEEVSEFKRIRHEAEVYCNGRVYFPYDVNGERDVRSNQDCYWNDNGCGKKKHAVLNREFKQKFTAAKQNAFESRKRKLREELKNESRANEFKDMRLAKSTLLPPKSIPALFFFIFREEQIFSLGKMIDSEKQDVKPVEIKRTHKDVMLEVMNKSKLFKYERQQQKADDVEKIEENDELFKGLLEENLVVKSSKKNLEELEGRESEDLEYEKLMLELNEDKKAQATEKEYTMEEQAKRDREKLEQMEAERKERLKQMKKGLDYDEGDNDANTKRDKFGNFVDDDLFKGREDVEISVSEMISKGKKRKIIFSDEIPFILECPDTFEELVELFKGYKVDLFSASDVDEVLDRIRKSNSVHLNQNSRDSMLQFHKILIEYVRFLGVRKHKKSSEVEQILYKHIYKLLVDLNLQLGNFYLDNLRKLQRRLEAAIESCLGLGFEKKFGEDAGRQEVELGLPHLVDPLKKKGGIKVYNIFFGVQLGGEDLNTALEIVRILLEFSTKSAIPEVIQVLKALICQCALKKRNSVDIQEYPNISILANAAEKQIKFPFMEAAPLDNIVELVELAYTRCGSTHSLDFILEKLEDLKFGKDKEVSLRLKSLNVDFVPLKLREVKVICIKSLEPKLITGEGSDQKSLLKKIERQLKKERRAVNKELKKDIQIIQSEKRKMFEEAAKLRKAKLKQNMRDLEKMNQDINNMVKAGVAMKGGGTSNINSRGKRLK